MFEMTFGVQMNAPPGPERLRATSPKAAPKSQKQSHDEYADETPVHRVGSAFAMRAWLRSIRSVAR